MNKVYTSCWMELLCGKLAENLLKRPGNVFSKTMIITQGGGMNAWLTAQIAKKNGIFAHFEFQNQDGFLGAVYEFVTGEKLFSSRDTIKSGIYGLLGTNEFKGRFRLVSDYYSTVDLRRMQLSEKIADLFDQYQLYRPQMIHAWESGLFVTPDREAEEWQQWLWRKLNLQSRASQRDRIFETLKDNPAELKENWPEIHLFGISIVTDFHREFYERLGNITSVNYYLNLPASQREFKNGMMESLGTKAAELNGQFPAGNESWSEFPIPGSDTLLHRLQTSIIQDEELQNKQPDESIQVSSFHSEVREIEGLYNFLLDLFERDRTPKPGDVLVVAPDINTYEPYVRAVFRNAPVYLPVQVSGAVTTSGDSITASLELLANLTEEHLTGESVMGLLEQHRIGQAYQVEDTAALRAMIKKAGIRFGIENRITDDTHFVSWTYGLERFILGYAMLSDEPFDVSYRLETVDGEEKRTVLTNYPFKDAEASASHDLLRLKAFVDDLQEMLNEQKEPRTFSGWKLFFLEKVMQRMVWSNDFDKNDRQERTDIYRALGFTEKLSAAAAAEEVPWDVFLYELKKRLFTESRSHELNSGAITFASAVPARGLPFKVIAFIGLDNDKFPGQDALPGFDLTGNDYRPGDRSKKEAGKSLFADTIMAARQKLYLSYIGQSIKDNTVLPPSIVLDNLMDYLGMEAVKHPLHGFSNRYDNDKLFTYLYNSSPGEGMNARRQENLQDNEEPETIWLHDFIKFFESPAELFFKRKLGIRYDSVDGTLPETELFGLDSLQQWQIQTSLLTFDGEPQDFIRREVRLGNLPLKNLGRMKVEELIEKVEPVRINFRQLTAGKQEQGIAIDLNFGNYRIRGSLDGIYGDQLVMCSFSDDVKKYKQRAWLNALLLAASGEKITTVLIHEKKNLNYGPLPVDQAVEQLERLTGWLNKGMKKPLRFTLKAVDQLGKDDQRIETYLKIFEVKAWPEFSNYEGDRYLQHLFEENYFSDFSQKDIDNIRELASLLGHL